MRKTVMAAAVALAALFVSPASAQVDPTKFYIHYPIVAEGHEGRPDIFAGFHPFDSKEACEKFRASNWHDDKEFFKIVSEWANEELKAHDGAVQFEPAYCWRLKDGPHGAEKPGQGV